MANIYKSLFLRLYLGVVMLIPASITLSCNPLGVLRSFISIV